MSATTIKLEGQDLLNLRLNAKNVPFAKEAKTKMKELGYDSYAKFTYKGIMFTSHEAQFLKDVEECNLAFVELEETMLPDDTGALTKAGYTLVGYHNYTQLEKLEEMESRRKLRNFKAALFNVDTLIKNPELLGQLDKIERIADASS